MAENIDWASKEEELKLFLSKRNNTATLRDVRKEIRDSGVLLLSLRRKGEISISGSRVEGDYTDDAIISLEPQGQLRADQARQAQPQLPLADAHGSRS